VTVVIRRELYNNIPQVSRICMRQTPHKVVDVGVGGERRCSSGGERCFVCRTVRSSGDFAGAIQGRLGNAARVK
jgi:hypothetical protein